LLIQFADLPIEPVPAGIEVLRVGLNQALRQQVNQAAESVADIGRLRSRASGDREVLTSWAWVHSNQNIFSRFLFGHRSGGFRVPALLL